MSVPWIAPEMLQRIMEPQRVTVQVRPLTERLWSLHVKSVDGTITDAETVELDAMCRAMEAEQDNWGEMK